MKKNILICGFYGNYNLGDEAMLAGMVNLFRDCNKDAKITVLSNDPKDTQSRFQVASLRSRSKKVLPAILNHEYFVLGGGDLLRDSVQKSVASSWLAYMQRALILKRRTMILGISVGEIWREETKHLVPKVLNKVDLIAVRDNLSKTRLEELGVSKKIYLISDLALQGLSIPSKKEPFREKSESCLEIGISVRHLAGRGLSLSQINRENLQAEIAKIIDFLIEKYNARIHFIPFRTLKESLHPLDDDYVSSLEVLRYSSHTDRCVVHRYFSSLDSLGQTISNLDLMIGMRLHSLILASGLGVPIIAAQYDPKVEGFMKEIKQSNFSFPLESFSYEKVAPTLCKTIENLPDVKQKLVEDVFDYKSRITSLEHDLKKILA